MATTRSNRHRDEPDDLRRKLALLEGDRKAYYESSQETIHQNKNMITALRKENHAMASRIKSEKRGAAVDQQAEVRKLRHTIHEMIAKHNILRHQCEGKERALAKVEREVRILESETAALEQAAAGNSAAGDLKTLENKLDRATIRGQEALHIGQTYKVIIEKMKQDRLSFDGQATALERAISDRRKELADLESMCTDAEMARNVSKAELAELEAELARSRSERQAEKARLNSLAVERRRQFEAMERRIQKAAAAKEDAGEDSGVTEEARWKILSYEDAMKEIRDATGVSDVDEVVQRFLAQGETRAHLLELEKTNKEQLVVLREEQDRLKAQFEALKYSGEARNKGNQRMLTEFETHLATTEQACLRSRDAAVRATQIFVDLKAGIENLHEKMDRLAPVQHRAAANVQDKLTESSLRLSKLMEDLEQRRSELPSGLKADSIAPVLPAHNTRIEFDADEAAAGNESEEEEELQVLSRDAMKRQAQSLVNSKSNKKGGKR